MKKTGRGMVFLLLVLLLSGCVSGQSNEKGNSANLDMQEKKEEVLVIGETMFLTQIDDIYYNFEGYEDTTVVVQGMYTMLCDEEGAPFASAVYRRGPGCCGNDGWGGFLLKYDGELPKENDWIEVTGTPELVADGDFQDLYLKVTKLEVLEERGAEFVKQ